MFQFVKSMLCFLRPLKLLELEKLGKWLGNDAIMAHKLSVVSSEAEKAP